MMLSVMSDDGEWVPLTGVADVEPTYAEPDEFETEAWQAGPAQPMTWTTPIRYQFPTVATEQHWAVWQVRLGAIAWWNERQRRG